MPPCRCAPKERAALIKTDFSAEYCIRPSNNMFCPPAIRCVRPDESAVPSGEWHSVRHTMDRACSIGPPPCRGRCHPTPNLRKQGRCCPPSQSSNRPDSRSAVPPARRCPAGRQTTSVSAHTAPAVAGGRKRQSCRSSVADPHRGRSSSRRTVCRRRRTPSADCR